MRTHGPGWTVISTKAPADIGNHALGPAIAFSALALVSIVLRWYTRAFITRRVGTEDLLITAAMIISLGMTGIIGAEFQLDMNNETKEVLAQRIPTMMKLVFAQSLSYHTSINLVKSSILFQYISLFFFSRSIQYLCYILLVLVIASWSWGTFGVIFLCDPVHKFWELAVPGRCMDPEKHFWSSAIFGIVLDFGLWFLPMPVIGKLKVRGKQRVGLVIVLGLGGFVCITSILRLVLVHDAAESGNVTKSGTYALIWSTVEVNVAIICASLLVMKPLFVRMFPRLAPTQASSRGDTRDIKAASRWPSNTLLQSNAPSKEKIGHYSALSSPLNYHFQQNSEAHIRRPESCYWSEKRRLDSHR
ncbi:hypothetical protein BDV96DRAFT_523333 [Lophiotrema nucula]|uniref:Rhodopsin domain-containing protein n=1 Tax=Lophiotrema nucula TaxID=690887 RepID=A0A6A5Z448_9PLEO|nr:hypothetical protein BDV96DRAFT_523333 [Lophiotrema nucula]